MRQISPEQMLKALMAAGAGDDAPRAPALIDVALRDEAAFYARENPFAVGDLVTPRKGTTTRGAGEAHIVLDVLLGAEYLFDGQPGSNAYGQRLDMRVLHWSGGRYVAHWIESAEFEPWTPASETEVGA